MQTKNYTWDDLNCFALDVSMWSGRARMTREDLKDPDAVPPDALASLGSLRLIDPDRLKPFNALKRRALRLLESHGVSFLNGFVVSPDKIDEIDRKLLDIKTEYDDAILSLVNEYEAQCEEWLAKNYQWAHILRPRLPSATDIQRKFSFDWSLFKVTPVSSAGHHGTQVLDNAKSSIGGTAVTEVSQMLGECARNLMRDGRTDYNNKSFNSVDKAIAKCQELAFLNPELGVLASLIGDIKSSVLRGALSNDVFRVIFSALASPESIGNVVKLAKAGVSLPDIGWALQPSVQQEPEPELSAPESEPVQPEPEPVQPEPIIPVQPEPELIMPDLSVQDILNTMAVHASEPTHSAFSDLITDTAPEPVQHEPVMPEPVQPEPVVQHAPVLPEPVMPELEFTGLMNLDGII